MPAISARDALRYATDSELLKLYAVLVGGWTLMVVGESTARTAPQRATTLVALVALLAGVLAFLSAVVAVAHKVIAELTHPLGSDENRLAVGVTSSLFRRSVGESGAIPTRGNGSRTPDR